MKKIYTTLLFAVFLLNISRATIHYTYVNQPIPIFSYCDMDNNGDNDFQFFYDANNSFYTITGIGATSYFAADAQSHAKAYALASGMGTYTWYNGSSNLDFFKFTSKYLMVKFNNGANTYYGWILLNGNHGSSGEMDVVSYAYQDVPDQTLTPGEGAQTGVEDVSAGTLKIYQQTGVIQILTQGNYKAAITNLSGQVVLEQNVITGKIDAAMLPQGLYILTLTDEKGSAMNRKIIL